MNRHELHDSDHRESGRKQNSRRHSLRILFRGNHRPETKQAAEYGSRKENQSSCRDGTAKTPGDGTDSQQNENAAGPVKKVGNAFSEPGPIRAVADLQLPRLSRSRSAGHFKAVQDGQFGAVL